MLSVHCPSCGGTNIFDETKRIPTYCAFCGAHLPDMTEFVKESLKLGINKQYLDLDRQYLEHDRQRHEMELETMDKDIRRTRVRSSGEKLRYITAILFMIIFGYLMYMILNIGK